MKGIMGEKMRTTADRIRHTILFEVLGLAISAPLASLILDKSLTLIGSLSIMLSITAMGLNYLFNLYFDKALLKLGRPVNFRPVRMRVLHAILFEGTILVLSIPMVAWWLNVNLWTAFLADIGFSLFFLVYAFIYNWIYDVVFPVLVSNEHL